MYCGGDFLDDRVGDENGITAFLVYGDFLVELGRLPTFKEGLATMAALFLLMLMHTVWRPLDS